MANVSGYISPPTSNFALVWQRLVELYGSDLKAASVTVFLANESGGTLVNHFYPESKEVK